MTGITVDMSDVESPLPFDAEKHIFNNPVVVGTSQYDERAIAMVSPRHNRKTIAEDNFLTTCGLCRRRLSHGHDIYMYRYRPPLSLQKFIKMEKSCCLRF